MAADRIGRRHVLVTSLLGFGLTGGAIAFALTLSTGAAAFPLLGGALVVVAWNAPFLVYLVAVPVGVAAEATNGIEETIEEHRTVEDRSEQIHDLTAE